MKPVTYSFANDLLPNAWLDRGVILYINHDEKLFAAKGFVVQGQPIGNLSPEHLANWRAAACAMLNSLELSANVQFYWTFENDYSEFLDGHNRFKDPHAHSIALKLHEERVHGYEQLQLENNLKYRKLFVFVNFEPQKSTLLGDESLRRHLSATREHRMLSSEWKAARQKLDQIVSMARHPFETCGMNTRPLKNEDYRRLFKRILSPLRTRLHVPEEIIPSRCYLWDHVLLSDIERLSPFLHIDDHLHAFVSMTNLPQETQTGFLQHTFNLSHPDYSVVVTLRTTEKQKEIKNLQSDYGSKKSLQKAREATGKVANIEMETQADEISEEIRTLTQTPQQILHVQLNVHLWADSEDELRKRIDEAVLKIGYCNGTQAVIERIAAPEALRACLPGWTREDRLDRFQVVKSVNAADFIPAHTDFIGTGRPQLLFPTPEGGLMTAHIFTESRPFHNVIVGETGGGKTFLINSIISQLLSQGLRSATIVSTKDEFEPLMKIYGGIKISFSEDNPVFLNPCAISGDKPSANEMRSMKSILETMFGEEKDETKRNLRESRIFKAASIAFESNGALTRLRHFRDAFRKGWEGDEPIELQRLAMILEPYCVGGPYGEFFDSDTKEPLDLSADFKFFDFSRIQKNKNLSAIMMMAVTESDSRRLSALPKHYMKASFFDECWSFIDSVAGSDYIENRLRVNRAYNCAVFLSTQQIADFLNSRISHVVMGNCHNFFLLRIRDHRAIEIMRKELSLTEELASRFSGMPDPSEVGYSSFIYVHRAETQHIAGEGLNRVSKPEALLYSTSPDISELRDQLIRSSSDPWKSICDLSQMTREQISNEKQKGNNL